MAKKIQLQVITPDKTVFEEESEFVVLPGHSGELGVLPGHVKLFSILRPGDIRVINGDQTTKLRISAGIVFIDPQQIRVLCPVARLA
ncbi:MAG: ATP synthase F1 subunit epsilon [Fibrobacter sp.]|nr:ATP synthase F1 subunit epsilon [Fibrobacter sp.]